MSSTVYLHIHQSDAVQFDDLAALHSELTGQSTGKWTHVSELMEYDSAPPEGTTFITIEDGEVALWDREAEEYFPSVNVWGCWSDDAYEVVARHMTAGKLVFRYSPEHEPDEYVVCAPGKVSKPQVEF